jgi:hypothetical protein
MRGHSRRDAVKEQFWRKAIAKFTTSGLTKSQFCKQEKLKMDVLRYWMETIAKRDKEQISPEPLPDQMEKGTFLPLIVAAERNPSERLPGTKQMAVAEMLFADGSVLLFNGITRETVQALRFGMRPGVE